MLSTVEKVLFLKSIDLFSQIPGEDLAAIALISSEERRDQADEIFAEGESGDALYLVIDGKVGGNASKWINHSCAPNVEADDESGQVYLLALRNIKVGDELFFDYGLVIDERYTPALKKRFECRCGAKSCRGTMLAPKGRKSEAAQRASGATKA